MITARLCRNMALRRRLGAVAAVLAGAWLAACLPLFRAHARAALYAGLGHESQYVFTPETMALIARQAIVEGDGNMTVVATAVERQLREHYPKCAPLGRVTEAARCRRDARVCCPAL